jgi:hypothetical protein
MLCAPTVGIRRHVAHQLVAGDRQAPPDQVGEVRNLLEDCYHKTVGDDVGYKIPLIKFQNHGTLHVVNHLQPYRAVGLFDYRGPDGEMHRYRIEAGYSYRDDLCAGSGLTSLAAIQALKSGSYA